MNRISLWLLAPLLLVGCADQPVKQKPLEDVVLVPEKKTVSIPDETLRECDPLPKMEERKYTEAETLDFMQSLVTNQSDCRKRKSDETQTLKKAFNSK